MNLEPLFPPHLDKIKEMSKSLLEHPEKKEVYSKILESQCGAIDDSQPVEQYNGTLGVTTAFVNAHQSPVGQVQWNNNIGTIYNNPGNVSGVRWGTGTLISNDLLLTAGHLFDQTGGGWQRPFQNGTSNIISAAEIATNMHVNFNYQVDPSGNLRAEQSFAVTDLVEYRLGGLDFAIARLAGNPGIAFGTTLVSETDANVGDMVCIIGHPAGVPKRIEAGPVNIFNGDYVGYNDIDTLGGNSGSGILRASDGRIIGVHTNGGCDSPGGHNWGVRITSIITQSTTIQNILHPTLKFTDDGGQTTLKFSDDKPPLKFIVDSGQLTLKFTDDGGGQPSLKFFDDGGQPTLKFTDDGGTLKHIDDVKLPGYDKQFGDHKLPGMDGYGVDPRI
ncbi:MAG: trypsin-like peptidase domain-containing protein, partial [Bacteroidales bacterium]|nr:trypsin-like peptidase domain-containing protein [Bacteroidales bacterium]